MTRHKLDLFSLFSGLFLVLVAVAALFGVGVGVAAWVWPTVLIVLGVVVIASVVTANRQTEEAVAAPTDPDRAAAMAAARDEVEEADHTTD